MRRRPAFNRGRWQTHRERCRIADKTPSPEDTGTVPLEQAVPEVMKSLGLEEQMWLHTLEDEWVKLVGPVVAKHARPGRYEKRKLSVFVDSSVWLNELKRYGQREMLEKLQHRFGTDKIAAMALLPDPEG